ncbi:MAG: hypothetical protein GY755_05990 [Chloroflexi bacterium]|nr:hypothetical protein [Chloroflexota bacterium]
MTTLERSLYKHDFGHLRVVAQLWGIELSAAERGTARTELSEKLLNPTLATEVTETLPAETRRALDSLTQNQGRILWSAFTREFGKIREFGAGKRDREKPYLSPISTAERLFYRALLARAFFDTPGGAQEFAYIPDDLFKIISLGATSRSPLPPELGRLARPEERKHILLANDHILDDITTSLAALRLGWEKPPFPPETSQRLVHDLLLAMRLITDEGIQTDSVKAHLEQSRANAFAQMRKIWQKSETLDELRQVPTLICEGEWINPTLDTRKTILGFLKRIQRGKWWSLNAFIADVKEQHPDFQRKAGEYDAWFIRSAEKDPKAFNQDLSETTSLPSKETSKKDPQEKPFGSKSLRGFEHWGEVEGALLRYFIGGVLYWLGIVDIAFAKENGDIKAFRLKEKTVSERSDEKGKIIVTSSGQITISRFAPRVAHYQISRFCEWVERKNLDEYKYQITTSSLALAKEQGLKISHLLGILKKFADVDTPPSLARALRRWELSGTEARVETLSLLRLSKPEDLRKLRESRASRFLGEVLSPTRVVVKAGASQKVMAALIEMGIFMEDEK